MIDKISKADEARKEESFNQLVRGELSAVEAYELALGKLSEDGSVAAVSKILSEHRGIVNMLKIKMRENEEVPEMDSGMWGEFVNIMMSGVGVMGDRSITLALKQGEELGVRQCEKLIDSEHLRSHDKKLISTDIIPKLKNHISVLERLNMH